MIAIGDEAGHLHCVVVPQSLTKPGFGGKEANAMETLFGLEMDRVRGFLTKKVELDEEKQEAELAEAEAAEAQNQKKDDEVEGAGGDGDYSSEDEAYQKAHEARKNDIVEAMKLAEQEETNSKKKGKK